MPEPARVLLVVPALFFALPVAAAEPATRREPVTFHAEDPKNWGSPRLVVPPDYPADALQRRHAGHVDFEAIVTPVEDVEVLQFKPDSGASAVFLEPLKKVIPYWRFHIVVGPDCQPSRRPLWTRVWFEIDGEKPKISVSLRDPATLPRGTRLKELERRDPAYPYAMQRSGYQANVFARMSIDASGEVTAVEGKAYPETRGVDLGPFVKATERALLNWRFPPAGDADPPRAVCKQVFFRLRD